MVGAAGVTGAARASATTGTLVAGCVTDGVDSAGIVIAAGRCTRADCRCEAIPNAGTDLAVAVGPTFRWGLECDC
jgi:hypothetical protein